MPVCWGWPLSSHMFVGRMGKHLPPCLNAAWESTSLRTTRAVLGSYLPTKTYLFLEDEPRRLTLKIGRPWGRVKTLLLLTRQLLRKSTRCSGLSPCEWKDEYSTWLRSETGSIKIKVLRHNGAAAIVCLFVCVVCVFCSLISPKEDEQHITSGAQCGVSSQSELYIYSAPSDCSTSTAGTVTVGGN